MPKSVFADRRITEIVWQRVPDCRACNRKRPTTELGATVSWHDELMATCRAEPLTTGNISRRLAAVHIVLRSIALQTPKNSHFELELLRSPRQGTIEEHIKENSGCGDENVEVEVDQDRNGEGLKIV